MLVVSGAVLGVAASDAVEVGGDCWAMSGTASRGAQQAAATGVASATAVLPH
jgi:hypothetical protein